ncbi:putative chitinase 2 [Nomia melanderi]|uniref:putative chitinase 2 n=1 Tax=Nomia melanderi TaxID=2448451 RepID=UPI001304799F|nr:probable chitinase 2 [Nomia melanderi]
MKVHCFLLLVILSLAINNASGSPRTIRHDKVVACYVASWAWYRPSSGKFGINDLQPELCTHLIYAFAGLNDTDWTIRSLDPYKDIENGTGDYRRITELRKQYPHLKVSLAIGGWEEGSRNYSKLASSPDLRKKFVDSVVAFLKEYGFNGFDLDWEFPASRGGLPADKENFVYLVKELKEAFKRPRYLLTAAISANIIIINEGYDIPEISKYLDHIHIMAYDYHGTWDSKVLPNSPMTSTDSLSVESTIKHLLNNGAPPSKLVLGLPMYGRTFILAKKPDSPQESPMNKICLPEGFKGPYTGQVGFMGYNEICEEIAKNSNNWSTGWDRDSSTPYAIKEDRVIVYDNPTSIKIKIEYAMKMNLGGVMIWSVDTDDFRGRCKEGFYLKDSLDTTDHTFPLMRTINTVLANYSSNNSEPEPNRPTNNDKSSADRCLLNVTLILFALLLRYA